MDQIIQNILPSKKQLLGINQDINVDVPFTSTQKTQVNDNIQDILDVANLLTVERQTGTLYNISGVIDVVSHFINIKKNIEFVNDLFDVRTVDDNLLNISNFFDFFDVYIMYPSELVKTNVTNEYNMLLKPLTKINDLDVFGCGFNINLYNENVYQFNFNVNVDIDNLTTTCNTDRLIDLPITNLYLYFNFKGYSVYSSLFDYTTSYNNTIKVLDQVNNNIVIDKLLTSELSYNDINTNGILYSRVLFDPSVFTYDIIDEYKYNITLTNIFTSECNISVSDPNCKLINVDYNYLPTSTIKIRDFSSNIEEGSVSGTTGIPTYAYPVENNNIVEQYFIDSNVYPVFSGATRLIPSDGPFAVPRKLIYNTNVKNYCYYLDQIPTPISKSVSTTAIMVTTNGINWFHPSFHICLNKANRANL